MAYNFTTFKTRTKAVEDWLTQEFTNIRTGKASPLLLDSVMVESYGAKVPLKQVAAISIEDAKTLKVTPWDNSQIKGIEQGIAAANLGISTAPDSSGVRVIFPDLTSERRTMMGKLVNEKMEEAKISLRQEREKVWNEIQTEKKDGKLTEDDMFRGKDELQKLVDESNKKLEEHAARKHKEIEG